MESKNGWAQIVLLAILLLPVVAILHLVHAALIDVIRDIAVELTKLLMRFFGA